MTNTDRCPGSGQPLRDVRNLSHLGSKFFGKSSGTCPVCGRSIMARKGTRIANPHAPQASER